MFIPFVDTALVLCDPPLDTPELTIPHREMWSRAFVLRPLLDVSISASLRRKAEDHLAQILGQEIRLYEGCSPATREP